MNKDLHAIALETARAARHAAANAEHELKIAEVTDNPALFIPIKSLGEYVTPEQNTPALQKAITALAKHYHFLGELVLEDKTSIKERAGAKRSGKPVMPAGYALIEAILNQFELRTDYFQNYTTRNDVDTQVRKTPLTHVHGKGPREAMQQYLTDEFATQSWLGTLACPDTIEIEDGHISMTFNIASESLRDKARSLDLNDPQFAARMDYAVKRAIGGKYFHHRKIDERTETCMDEFPSEKRIEITHQDTGVDEYHSKAASISVRIPLYEEIEGAFRKDSRNGHKLAEIAKQAVAKELLLGISASSFKPSYTHG